MPNNPTPTPLGRRLQELRAEVGLTLYELERRSGVNRAKLLRLETGEIRQPTQETLNKLAAALEVDPEEFYDLVWQDTAEPLPSLQTYFRSKYHFNDDQIAVIERAMGRAEKQPKPSGQRPPAPSLSDRPKRTGSRH